jgi:hypothetical protein
MGSHAACSVRKPRHDLCDRDDRGVAGEDRRRRGSRLYGLEQLALELGVLCDCLDDEIRAGDGLFEHRAGAQTLERRWVSSEIVQICLNSRMQRFQHFGVGIEDRDGIVMDGKDLGDAVSHEARANHCDLSRGAHR